MGVFNPPPTNGSSYPDIPVLQIEPAAQQLGKGLKSSGWVDDFVVKLWSFFNEAMGIVISALIGGIDDIAAFFVRLLTQSQGIGQPGMLNLMSAVLGDLLGIEFSGDELIASFQKGGRIRAMKTAGTWLYDTLTREFGGQALDPSLSSMVDPARGFLGFMVEFAVREGNLAYMSELIPEEFNPFGGLREYGVTLARNLGLGRLSRQALRPLIQQLVAHPLEQAMNRQYRPKMLSESELIKAYKRGDLSRDQLYAEMAWLGYRDDRVDLLLAEDPYKWHARELLELYRLGEMPEQEVLLKLQTQGVDADTAALLWQAYQGESGQGPFRMYLSELLHEVRQGNTTIGRVRAEIAAGPLTDTEKEWWNHVAGTLAEFPMKHLTEAELERAFLGGLTDMSTVQARWTALGYSADDVQTMTLLLLQKQSTSNRTKAGHTPHKTLTEAQAETAYKNGVINLAQLQAYWHAMGYSADDQAVLSALVQLKTPGPGATQLPGLTTP